MYYLMKCFIAKTMHTAYIKIHLCKKGIQSYHIFHTVQFQHIMPLVIWQYPKYN